MNRTVSPFSRVCIAFVSFLMFNGSALAGSPPRATLSVDATEIARRLVHVQMELPVEEGPMALNYVQWTPGNHNPSGPIQNVVDLVITDDHGRPIPWTRDREKMTRLLIDVARSVDIITMQFSYITNQPSIISRSTDTYGFSTFGGLNWNTVLFYPDDVDKDEYIIEAELRFPHDWRSASSLPRQYARRGRVMYEPVSLARLVDSPVVFGSTLRTYELSTGQSAPHFIHAVAPFEEQTELGAERLQKLGAMVDQCVQVFGDFPRPDYHFLILLSDDVPGLGVEHTQSTYISLGENRFEKAEKNHDPLGVLAHEYIHSWCGKLRDPEGLLARDYHTTADTRLLWVYEGLTSYLDNVVSVRSRLMTEEEYIEAITNQIADLQLREGRLWRSVEDTAVSLRFLRSRSPSWYDRRRGTSYYSEGALFWMEADAIIRLGTDNERSLDDFTRAFFDVPAGKVGTPTTYTRDDIVVGLAAVFLGEDWDTLIRKRIEEPVDSLPFDLVTKLGYQLDFVDSPSAVQKKRLNRSSGADLRYSLGFTTNKTGKITRIIPDSLADRAGLSYGMSILAVNEYTFTAARLRQAVKQSPTTGHVTLLIEFGDKVETKTLRYKDGPRWPRLVHTGRSPDVLKVIMEPR